MKLPALQRLAAARDENQARKCFTVPVAEAVWQFAQELESAHLWRSAAVALELARLAAQATGDQKVANDAASRSGFIAGFKQYLRGEIEPALAGLRDSAEAFADGGDTGRAISTFVAISRIALRNKSSEQTFAAAGRALDLLSTGGGSNESLLQMYLLDRDIFESGAGPEHASLFARANSVFKLRGGAQYTACAAALLGCTLVRTGDIETGLEILDDVSRVLRRAGILLEDGGVQPVPEVFLADYWTARAHALTGRLEEAERAFRKHPWMEDPNVEPAQRDKLVSRAVEVLIELEQYNSALQMLHERLDGKEAPTVKGRALLLSQLAVLDTLLGQPKLAGNKISEVRELIAQIESSDDMVLRARLHVLDASRSVQNTDVSALESELAAIESESTMYLGEIMPFEFDRIRGDLALARGDAPEAVAQYQRALERAWSAPPGRVWSAQCGPPSGLSPDVEQKFHLRRTIARRRERGVGLRLELGIARAKALAGQDPTPELDHIIEFASAANRASTLFYALHEKARQAAARHDPTALGLMERSIDVLEGLRAAMREVSLQIGALADKEGAYGDLLRLAVGAPPRTELAMRVMERAKARGLLDQMAAGREEAAPAERDLAAYLRRKIVRLLRRQLVLGDQTDVEVRRTKEQLGAVFQRAYSRRGMPVAPATPAEIISLAAEDSAVVHYFIDHRGTFASVATAGQMHAPIFLPEATLETVGSLLDSFTFELKTRRPSRALEELYAIVFQPLTAHLQGVSSLLVLPHRILHRVPFHALLDGEGRYVAEKLVLTYAPSASFALRSSRAFPGRAGTAGPSVVIGVSRTTYLPLEMLGEVQLEVTAVAERLADCSVLRDDEAGRRSLLGLRGDINVLHLACHAEFDEDDPLLSRLYLADGPVYAYELPALDAHPRLIVLSACESGARAFEAGDESFGLIRPLLTTGCDGVLSSLWKISDRGAAAFMKLFYEQRRQFASDPPRCLAETQRALMRSEEYAHPYYWAPYMMVGRQIDRSVH
jgi:CHAT domain-containing protein/tetratricopeptide (TPR) repeat protein